MLLHLDQMLRQQVLKSYVTQDIPNVNLKPISHPHSKAVAELMLGKPYHCSAGHVPREDHNGALCKYLGCLLALLAWPT